MADDAIELILEGASAGIDNYEKVVDPVKDRVKRLPNPVKSFRRDRNGREVEYDDDDDDDDSPSPRYSDRRVSRQDRTSRGGEEYVEESYERRMGRARSTGRDGRHGGRGLDRDGRSRSNNSITLRRCRLTCCRPPAEVPFRLRILHLPTAPSSQISRRTSLGGIRHRCWGCSHRR